MQETWLADARRLLDQDDLAQRMNPETQAVLLEASECRCHAAGQTLSRRGDPVNELLFVLQGTAEVSMVGEDGRRSICWYLAPGDWFGLIPVVDGMSAIHDLQAYSDAVMMHIPRSTFLAVLESDRLFAMKCLKLLCERSRNLYEHVAAEALLPLRSRIARLLLMLVEQHGQQGEHGMELSLKLSQEALADMLGIRRQTLNRELNALVKARLISLAYTQLTLLDHPGLKRLSMFNPSALG